MTMTLDAESALEDEAHQRNQQTADDFPPGTVVYICGDRNRWTVDSRYRGSVRLERTITPGRTTYLNLPPNSLHHIDPTR